MPLKFEIPGIPVAKGRPRMTTVNGQARSYTPAKTVAYEGLVAHEGRIAMAGRPPLDGPIAITVKAWFPIAASWTKKRKAEAHFHIGKPDADNLLKAIGDGLNGVVWNDDSQISQATVIKLYGAPGVEVEIWRLKPAIAPAANAAPSRLL